MLIPTKSWYYIIPETSLIFIFVLQINCFPYVDNFEGLGSHHPRTHTLTHTCIFSLSESMQKRSRAWLSSVFHLLIQEKEITKSSKGKRAFRHWITTYHSFAIKTLSFLFSTCLWMYKYMKCAWNFIQVWVFMKV